MPTYRSQTGSALQITRRHFFGNAGDRHRRRRAGVAAELAMATDRPAACPGCPHFAPKAKRVIYLHQSGAPSQIDLFDYKPALKKLARHGTAGIHPRWASASPA